MKETKQASLTSYYSTKKLNPTLHLKQKGKESIVHNEAGVLRTPTSGKSARAVPTSDECHSVPSKRQRLDSSPDKTPTTSECNATSRNTARSSARKRLQLQCIDTSKLPLCSLHPEAKKQCHTPNEVSADATSPQASASANPLDTIKFDKVKALQKLNSSDNLNDLKERLNIIQEKQAQLAELRRKKQTKPGPAESQPAYAKYEHLADPSPPSLILPYSYKQLSETFRCCDTVVSILFNRKEVCTFEKLKHSVEEMTKKRFSEKQLGQIKAVFPGSYELGWEKLQQRGIGSSDLKLVINLSCRDEEDKAETFSAAALLKRRKLFNSLLLSIVKKYHEEFLSNMDSPMTIPTDMITRWHPKFPLESVPEIVPVPLAQSPQHSTCSSARGFLDKFKGKMNDRIEKALQSIVEKHDTTAMARPATSPSNVVLRGVPEDLLERIRQRESLKMVRQMTMKPEAEKERSELSYLPEFIRIVRALFLEEQKAALPRDELLKKVRESFSTLLSVAEVEALGRLASKVLPDWFKVLTIRRGTLIKIVKEKDVSELVERAKNKLNV